VVQAFAEFPVTPHAAIQMEVTIMKKATLAMLVALCATVFVTGAHAAADVGIKGIGARIGWVSAEDVDATFQLGTFVNLGTVADNMALTANLDFWRTTEENPFGDDVSFRDIALSGRANYMFPVENPKFSPFVGGGVSLHFLTVNVPAIYLGSVQVTTGLDDTEIRPGLDLGGGFGYQIAEQMDLVTDAWASFVSDANQFALRVGLQYNLD